MKQLEAFVNEKLKIGKVETIFTPKTKEELVQRIIKEIEVNGSECSLNHIDVSNINEMGYLFNDGMNQVRKKYPTLSDFDGDISNWNVSNVTDMRFMFAECKYTGKNGDISDWDVSNVECMTWMFAKSSFSGDISKWDVSRVRDMENMFSSSPLENTPPKWYHK